MTLCDAQDVRVVGVVGAHPVLESMDGLQLYWANQYREFLQSDHNFWETLRAVDGKAAWTMLGDSDRWTSGITFTKTVSATPRYARVMTNPGQTCVTEGRSVFTLQSERRVQRLVIDPGGVRTPELHERHSVRQVGIVDENTLAVLVYHRQVSRLLFVDSQSGHFLNELEAVKIPSGGCFFRRVGDQLILRWLDEETGRRKNIKPPPVYSALRRPAATEQVWDMLYETVKPAADTDIFDLTWVDGSVLAFRHVGGGTISVRQIG